MSSLTKFAWLLTELVLYVFKSVGATSGYDMQLAKYNF